MPLYSDLKPSDKNINRLNGGDKSFHDWYRFVLSFPPHLVSHYLSQFGAHKQQVVLDPFSGTGTTLVECKKLGFSCIGIEANPMAHFASQTKLNWSVSPRLLLEHAGQVTEQFTRELDHSANNRQQKSLIDDAQKLMFKNAISSRPLHKVLTLLNCIEDLRHHHCYDHERLAFAKAAVRASNIRFAPEVGISKTLKEDAPVLQLWQTVIETMADDIATFSHEDREPLHTLVYLGDARTPSRYLPKHSVDIVITSPPYPNEKDYTRATRLESVLLGFFKNKQDLQTVKKTLVRSNSRGIYTKDDDDRLSERYPEVLKIAQEIERRRMEWRKTSGFSRLYSRAVKLYFGGMARHLKDLQQVLRPNAQLAYVVGDQASYLQVHIRTGEILAHIAQDMGYKLLDIDLFRTRRASKTDVDLCEEVVLLQWPGSF
ncbi:MAG: DNA methyltransferase [Cyanobacteria bacterium P01_H01_bin.105]